MYCLQNKKKRKSNGFCCMNEVHKTLFSFNTLMCFINAICRELKIKIKVQEIERDRNKSFY